MSLTNRLARLQESEFRRRVREFENRTPDERRARIAQIDAETAEADRESAERRESIAAEFLSEGDPATWDWDANDDTRRFACDLYADWKDDSAAFLAGTSRTWSRLDDESRRWAELQEQRDPYWWLRDHVVEHERSNR